MIRLVRGITKWNKMSKYRERGYMESDREPQRPKSQIGKLAPAAARSVGFLSRREENQP